MIPKIVHYCWLSSDIVPADLQKYMNSWKEKLSDYEFVLWNFERFGINTSVWVNQAFEAKKYAFAADFIRLYAVYNYGGIYLDMDVEVIKSFDELLNNDIMIGYEDDKTKFIEAGCFGAKKGHPFIKQCLNYYNGREFIKSDGCYDIRPLPQIMTEIANDKIFNYINFYSSDYFTAKCNATGTIKQTNNTYSIHHFAGSWLPQKQTRAIRNRQKLYSIFGDNVFTKFLIFCIFDFNPISMLMRFLKRFFIELGPVGTFRHYYELIFKNKKGKAF